MVTFAWYLLKVLLCSGILYGYYLISLRNKVFHRWNRFYLLAAVILSLWAPLIKINIQNAEGPKNQVVQLLEVVNSSDEIVFEYSKSNGNNYLDASNLSFLIYLVVSALLSALLLQTLLKIHRLKKHNRHTIIEGINFINTNVKRHTIFFF